MVRLTANTHKSRTVFVAPSHHGLVQQTYWRRTKFVLHVLVPRLLLLSHKMKAVFILACSITMFKRRENLLKTVSTHVVVQSKKVLPYDLTAPPLTTNIFDYEYEPNKKFICWEIPIMDRVPNSIGKLVVPVIRTSTRPYLMKPWEPRGSRWYRLARVSTYNGNKHKPLENTCDLYIARYREMGERGIGSSAWDQSFERERMWFIYIARYRAMRARDIISSARDQ